MKIDNLTRAGVIDIGSSSIKLIIGEQDGENIKALEFLKNFVPIGKATFFKGRISQEAINATLNILDKYKQKLKEYGIEHVFVIATTAVREARNRDIFIDAVKRKTGFRVEVLTVGDVIYYIDSYLSYKLKNSFPLHTKNLLIAELGAGSLDISLMEKGFTHFNIGLPIGTHRIRQLWVKLDGTFEENCEATREYIDNEFAYLKRAIPNTLVDDVILIDENCSEFLPRIVPGLKKEAEFFRLKKDDIDLMFNKLMEMGAEDFASEFNLPLEIADTFSGYVIILHNFLSMVKETYLNVLDISLAEAVLANSLLGYELAKRYNKVNQLVSTARFICQRFNTDLNHAKHVAALSKMLFDGLKDYLGLVEDDFLYLVLAAYLHDIGSVIHNRSHHKHSEYIINSLNLFRMTEDEIKTIACIGRYHRRGTPNNNHLLFNSLDPERQILVQKLVALLRMANALDTSHRQKVKKLEVKIKKNEDVSLIVNTKDNFNLERIDFAEKKEFFEEITGNKVSLIIRD